MTTLVESLYSSVLAQLASEAYLSGIPLNNRAAIEERLLNGNNHFLDGLRPAISPPEIGLGATRQARWQRDEFFNTYDIIDHLPNQASGFSATLLKNKTNGEYTLAFRSTEYRDIASGGDAERDSIRGAAGDIAFNGMAFAQASSMEKYWQSLLDGTRERGATPDNPGALDTSFLRADELGAFRTAVAGGTTKINVSGYSLGGHLATLFSTFHGEQVSSLYLFNSSGVGAIRAGFPVTAYKDALETYEHYLKPENFEAALRRFADWADLASGPSVMGVGLRARLVLSLPLLRNLFVPKEFAGYLGGLGSSITGLVGGLVAFAREQQLTRLPRGDDGLSIVPSSALHFLVSLFAAEAIAGTYVQTLWRGLGTTLPSLQESGLIPAGVRIYQLSGVAADGAPSIATFGDMLRSTDWNIVADSGIRAAADSELLSVYIENQPVTAGIPFTDRGWGDFGNTHSITLIADSLAVVRMLQKAQPALPQEAAEEILRAASNLRKERVSAIAANALTEHDTLERVVDSLGRVLFGRRVVGAIDWSKNLASADGVSSFGLLEFRDPFYGRIQAIENELAARGLSGALEIVSLAGLSAANLVAEASAASERGKAARYALKELDPFFVVGPGLYDGLGRSESLSLYDAASGTGTITNEWLQDRADFLALKLRLGRGDLAYESGARSALYGSAGGEVALSIAPSDASALSAPNEPVGKSERGRYASWVRDLGSAGRARLVLFGADGDPAGNPSTVQGGADRLLGRAGADRLYGEGGNDDIAGGEGDDYLEGGRGDDTLIGGRGSDVLAGGSGYDTYLRIAGDGSDRIVEVRETEGQIRGRVVMREGISLLAPRLFKRDESAAGEVYHSPDRRVTLTHGATWVLAFADGSVDLGADLRDGDFGFRLESTPPPPAPTVIGGVVHDTELSGIDASDPILAAGYGHDRLYANGRVTLEEALLVASAAPVSGWGYWLSAGPGNDLSIGSAADDVLYGGGGLDTLVGGPGNDLIEGDEDFVPVPKADRMHLRWEHADDPHDGYFTAFLAPIHVVGTGILDGYREQLAEAADIIHGGGGNDRLNGAGGEDLIYGDPGDDLILGGADADVLIGGEGADRITGELHGYAPVPFEVVGGHVVLYPHYVSAYGDDIIDGGAGDDELIGEGGADVVFGGDGADFLYGDLADLPEWLHGNDILDGGDGDDAIFGQGGDDLLFGGSGDDLLIGDSDVEARIHGADTLYGDSGNDILVGAGGADVLDGGTGDDTLFGDAVDVAAAWHGDDVLDGGSGDDTLFGLGGADELFGGEGNDRLHGDDPDLLGAGEADFLDGGSGDDTLRGQGGDDRLQGGTGSDSLFGEAGDDTLAGGPGADVLDGGAGNNVFELSLGDGADRVIAGSGAITLAFLDGVDVEALRASRILGTPAGIAPLQIRYSATDSITIEGLTDDDRVRIRIGDAELMRASELTQLTRSAATALTGSSASELLLADAEHPQVFAFAGDDLLVGSEHADELHGGSGDDELEGLGGDDVLFGGEGSDRLVGGAGDDRMEGGAGDDRYEFAFDAGVDSAIERSGEGINDVVALAQGTSVDSIRLRRSGNDLVLTERGGSGRLFVRNWYANEADPGIDAIVHDGGSLNVSSIAAQVIADRTLLGSAGDDTLTGDEFGDILIGSTGDDVLAGLAGDDRYIYARGDGKDRIVDTGGSDWLEFGAGIDPGEIRLVGRPDGEGGLSISLGLGAEEARIVFGAAREKRIESFQFASGEVLDYAGLLRRAGGLLIEGGSGDDALQGTFFQDSIYGFAGNDMLHGDGGADLLAGGEGDDILAGGADDDTYVFNAGDGRDSILEYSGTEEYFFFKGYFTPEGKRAFEVDGVVFETHEPYPGFFGETFNLVLGSVAGGRDTIRFGAGIAPEDIRLGLDLGKPLAAYNWIAPRPEGGVGPGNVFVEQVAYVLEIGTSGDAIELLWPNVELAAHAAATWIGEAPVERLVFGEGESLSIGELFMHSGGLSYIRGTAAEDVLDAERVAAGGWLGGGAGDDVYLHPEVADHGILESADGGVDTVVFGEGTAPEALRLVREHDRLFVTTGSGRLELIGFSAAAAEHPLVERFEFADASTLEYGDLLARGIALTGSELDDHLTGTSAYDDVVAGAGNDRIDSAGGDDIIDAQAGNDVVIAGAGDDYLAAGAGADVLHGGLGRDRYLYLRGDGGDVIEELGVAGEEDTVHFAGDIAPAEVGVRRAGADLVLALRTAGDAITIRDWFASDAMRVERVHFNDGTDWDAAALAALAGETLPVPPVDPPVDPSVDPPIDPSVDRPIDPSVDPPVGPPVAPPSEPAEVPPAIVDTPAAPPPGDPGAAPAPPPVIAETPVLPPAMPSAVLSSLVSSLPPGASASSDPPADSSPDSAAAPALPAADAGSSSLASPAGTVPAATMESLAAAGFVSPGRPSAAAPADATVEPVEPDSAPPEEVGDTDSVAEAPAGNSMAAYWRWMHARLDEHLEASEADDLGAPPIQEYRSLVPALADASGALAPARSVGVRDRGALDARVFDGLRDGFARLG